MLEIINVSYYYKTNKSKKILDEVSMQFEEGVFYAIVGPSGSGKTTFLSLLAGLDTPIDGMILYDGMPVTKNKLTEHRKHNISLVFQNYNLIDYLTPEENVRLGGNRNAVQLLQEVGIDKHDMKRNVMQLSGGQQQRVAIARAIVNNPKVLIADEPTGNLDPEISWEIMQLLERINLQGTTVLMATHNKQIVDNLRHRVIAIEEGRIVRDEEEGEYGYND